MNRRAFIAGLGSLYASWPFACRAQSPSEAAPSSQRVPLWGAWKWRQSIVVMSGKGDPRISAVHEARSFWNVELSKLGTSFRLGPVSHVVRYVQLEKGSYRPPGDLFNFLIKTGGDVMVALSPDSNRSFTTSWGSSRKLFIQIASEHSYHVKAPAAASNIVAHELELVLGAEK